MSEKLHRLAALRVLGEGMTNFERLRQQRIDAGENPAEVDRDIAQLALTCAVGFCLDLGIEAGPLHRLLGGLEGLSAGAKAPEMLRPSRIGHRRVDSPNVEGVKGRLAAIMEFKQKRGLSRKDAAQWVARNVPPELKRCIGPISARAVESWRTNWGGRYGTKGSGQEGYRHMREILTARVPAVSDSDLSVVMATLAQSLLA